MLTTFYAKAQNGDLDHSIGDKISKHVRTFFKYFITCSLLSTAQMSKQSDHSGNRWRQKVESLGRPQLGCKNGKNYIFSRIHENQKNFNHHTKTAVNLKKKQTNGVKIKTIEQLFLESMINCCDASAH